MSILSTFKAFNFCQNLNPWTVMPRIAGIRARAAPSDTAREVRGKAAAGAGECFQLSRRRDGDTTDVFLFDLSKQLITKIEPKIQNCVLAHISLAVRFGPKLGSKQFEHRF
jgi:hypothetical protein